MRRVRTSDDRIVCWFIWWVEAMEHAYPIEMLVGEEDNRPAIKACIPSFRKVLSSTVSCWPKVS
jgi:hypothetical protein